jgi:hypothetical protein
VLFYVRSHVQRWFFALAMLSLAARLLFLRIPCGCSRPTSFWYFLSVLPLIGFAGVSLMSSAALFRTVSSLRSVYLIPLSRRRLIVGLLLAQLLVAALVTLLVVALRASPVGALDSGSARGTFEYVFGVATLVIVALQVIAGPSRVASVIAGALLLTLLARLDVFMQPEIAGLPTADVLTLLALASWAAYAAWYCHTGPIGPVASVWRARRARLAPSRATRAIATRAAAIDAYLLGQATLWIACRKQAALWMSYIAMTGIVMSLSPFLFTHLRQRPLLDFSPISALLLMATAVVGNLIAGGIARRSRSLWLRSGDSRRDLFAIAERLGWRALALVGVPFLLAAALVWRFLPHLPTHAVYPLVVYLTLAPCGVYCGLLNFTRTSDLRFLALLLIAQGGVIAAVLHEDARGLPVGGVQWSFWALPLALGLLAVVLRRRAERRWLTIDWLRYRAPRPSSMGLRAAQ